MNVKEIRTYIDSLEKPYVTVKNVATKKGVITTTLTNDNYATVCKVEYEPEEDYIVLKWMERYTVKQ